MKLYISSQKLGRRTDLLVDLVGDNKNVVVIANALDDKSISHRKNRVNQEKELMKSIGFAPEELDLRQYINKQKELELLLKTKSLVWIRGGNTFLLSRIFEATGFDKIIVKLVKENKIVYGGYSAAALIASKGLLGTDIVDDINSIPIDYPKMSNLRSLKLLQFYLIPHFGCQEVWAKNVVKQRNYLINKNEKVVTMCDGEVYYCNGKKGYIV